MGGEQIGGGRLGHAGTAGHAIQTNATQFGALKLIQTSQVGEDEIVVGGSVTLTRLHEACHALADALPRHRTRGLRAIAEQLKYFAGVQVRCSAPFRTTWHICPVPGTFLGGSHPVSLCQGFAVQANWLSLTCVLGYAYFGVRLVQANPCIYCVDLSWVRS